MFYPQEHKHIPEHKTNTREQKEQVKVFT